MRKYLIFRCITNWKASHDTASPVRSPSHPFGRPSPGIARDERRLFYWPPPPPVAVSDAKHSAETWGALPRLSPSTLKPTDSLTSPVLRQRSLCMTRIRRSSLSSVFLRLSLPCHPELRACRGCRETGSPRFWVSGGRSSRVDTTVNHRRELVLCC